MPAWRLTPRTLCYAFALFSLALTACGEIVAPIAEGSARLSGTLVSNSGQVVSGARVQLPYGQRRAYAATTDSKGKFSFDFDVTSFSGVSPVLVATHSQGFRPAVFLFEGFNSGTSYSLDATGASALTELGVGEYIPESSEARLIHLGDANFGGEVNSQLQTSTDGMSFVLRVTTWTSQLASAGYSNAVISFVGRGIQSSICTGNAVGLDGGTLANFTSARPSDSPSTGGFGRYSIQVRLPSLAVGNQLRVFATSSTCGGSDFDDFEIGELLVRLVP